MSEIFEKEYVVQEADSAKEMGSGSLSVLSTPSLIAFMENAAMLELNPSLSEGETSVGIEMNMKHVAASPIGAKVKVTSQITESHKSIRTFEIKAYEEDKLIGEAVHKRAIVNSQQFMSQFD